MFFFVVAASVGIALIRGGRADRLASFPFRHLWLVFAAFGVQLVLHVGWFTRLAVVRAAAPYLYPSAYYLLLLCFVLNRRAPGVIWLAAGSLANLAVITLNGGKMPVDGQALVAMGCQAWRDLFASGRSLTNTLVTQTTRLPWLADVLVGSPPFPRPTLFSAGDVLLAVGVFVLVQKTMVPDRRSRGGIRRPGRGGADRPGRPGAGASRGDGTGGGPGGRP